MTFIPRNIIDDHFFPNSPYTFELYQEHVYYKRNYEKKSTLLKMIIFFFKSRKLFCKYIFPFTIFKQRSKFV